MKIAHLVIGGDVAGGQVVALGLARAARERGDIASFVVPRAGPFVDVARAEDFETAIVDVGRIHRVAAAVRLVHHLKSERVDVLHTHTLAAANTVGRVAARIAGVPVVSHLHIENYFRPQTRALIAGLDNATARLCAALIAVSEDTRRSYLAQGYPDRIVVVPNGVDVEPADADGVREELGVPPHAPLIAEVARLCAVKGQRELIAAAADIPGAHVVLVGDDIEQDGAYRRDLEQQAAALGLAERVVFAGRRDDVPRVLAAADVVALPSWTEGLPLVVLEAMAQQRPVVATAVGGTPEVVEDGVTGLLVPPRDARELAAALRRVLDDDALRARLGANARDRVRRDFSASTAAASVLAVYDEVVA